LRLHGAGVEARAEGNIFGSTTLFETHWGEISLMLVFSLFFLFLLKEDLPRGPVSKTLN
jgi:hypothetical protein